MNHALSNAIAPGAVVDLRLRAPPITPPIACGTRASAITSISASSSRRHAVEGREPFSGPRPTNQQRPALRQPVEIERVHRLAGLDQHVVGDVDDVVDRADTGGLRAASPARMATGPPSLPRPTPT